MEEIFKDIPGFEGIYQVSNMGNIKTFNYLGHEKESLLKLNSSKGYLHCVLYRNGKRNRFKVHRLVMLVFSGESNGLQVNHKDGNKSNNKLDNLEYCTSSENQKHSFYKLKKNQHLKMSPPMLGRFGEKHHGSKKIGQYGIDGSLIKTWDSINSAVRNLGVIQQNISKVCRGQRKTAGGFIWKFIP